MSKNFNYNTDLPKHYVRYNGWLPTFRAIRNYVDRLYRSSQRDKRCKYLTFCAMQAVDVFMFEQQKFLYREPETKRLSNVYFFENEIEAYTTISRLIGSESQGFYGDFQKVILQDIENEVISDDPFNEPSSEIDREDVRLKEVKKNVLQVFPFDVINLDFYGNFFPSSEERYSEACRAYTEILKLQKLNNGYTCARFAMFLTVYTPVREGVINENAMSQLQETLFANMAYDSFRKAFSAKYGNLQPNQIDFHLKFILGFTKQIIFKESYKNGWCPEMKNIFCYERTKQNGENYMISTFIVEYKRNSELDHLQDLDGAVPGIVREDYLQQLQQIIENEPSIISGNDEDIPGDVRENLNTVIEFRKNFLASIGIEGDQPFIN